MPRVSVIMATYNHATFIGESLKSILNQTFDDFEVIVVNDGSSDNTEEVLSPYMDKIRYHYQDNAGPEVAHNLGIASSKGEFVAFLNSDDIWAPIYLERQISYLDSHEDAGLVFTDYIKIDINGDVIGPSTHSVVKPCKELNDLIRKNSVWIGAVVVRREWLDKVGLFDPRTNPMYDYDMWLRLSVQGCNFGYVPEILAKYRKHTRNISSYHTKAALSHIIALRKLKSRIRESPTAGDKESLRLIDDRIGREKAILIIGLLGEGRSGEAKELARELFLTRPHVFRNLFVFLECYFPFLSGIRRTAISVKKIG